MHNVTEMIELLYLPSERARKWRRAYRMHTAGKANMESEAPKLAAQEGWHKWKIETVQV